LRTPKNGDVTPFDFTERNSGGIGTQLLDLAMERQKSRATENVAFATFDFTEG